MYVNTINIYVINDLKREAAAFLDLDRRCGKTMPCTN